jgi:hypothetical protein
METKFRKKGVFGGRTALDEIEKLRHSVFIGAAQDLREIQEPEDWITVVRLIIPTLARSDW